MPKLLLNTKSEPVAFDFEVAVQRPCRVRVKVYNPDKPATVYFDRWKDVVDTVSFEVKMPQSAPRSELIIGCVNNENDDNVRLIKGKGNETGIRKKKLDTYLQCLNGNGNGERVKEFVKFAQEFCENAALYDTKRDPRDDGGSYYSDKNNFRIDYFNMISDGGRTLSTPARIHNRTGRMEVAKRAFVQYSVPSRMAILLHEFAHFNLNEEQTDEIEADLNALKIYLGLGYPIIEAHKGFLDVFKSHPSNENRQRYEYLKNFIDNFDSEKYRICLP